MRRDFRCWQIVLQNSQNAVLPISRKQTKRAEIAEQYSLQAVTEVACELWQDNVVPQMIIRSPNVRSGEFAIGDAKRLLQQYLPEADKCGIGLPEPIWADRVRRQAVPSLLQPADGLRADAQECVSLRDSMPRRYLGIRRAR